jgi:hypothetical protein
MKKSIVGIILCISWALNAQVALPTFQGVQNAGSELYSFSSHTFTNCGSTGKTGPTLANCKSSYDTSWEGDTDLFNVQTQGIQEWTVPKTGSYTIEVYGAEGGIGQTSNTTPGGGARMRGTFSLQVNQILKILVGQQGSNGTYIGGGGGGTFVWISGETSAPLITAGGGGGAGHSTNTNGIDAPTSNNGTNCNGGSSGAGSNGSGGVVPSSSTKYAAGGAGWLSNGNNGSTHSCSSNSTGGTKPLSGGTGGTGGGSAGSGGFGGGGGGNARCGAVGGGGGGGYSGGGGGYEPPSFPGGGGGGSYNSGSNQSNTAGAREGHGQVIITLN